MNILVCVKQVPAETDLGMDENGTLIRSGAQMLNTADEAALEAGLRLKGAGCVTVLTMGRETARPMLLECAQRGAGRLALLSDKAFAGSDTLATARALAAAVRLLGPFDLILCGRRAIDGETGQVPSALAALLDFPVVTNVTSLSADDAQAVVSRLIETGMEQLNVPLPAVLSLTEYCYSLRLPSLAGMRAAREMSVEVLTLDSLSLDGAECGLSGSPTRVSRVRAASTGARHATVLADASEGAALLYKLLSQKEEESC